MVDIKESGVYGRGTGLKRWARCSPALSPPPIVQQRSRRWAQAPPRATRGPFSSASSGTTFLPLDAGTAFGHPRPRHSSTAGTIVPIIRARHATLVLLPRCLKRDIVFSAGRGHGLGAPAAALLLSVEHDRAAPPHLHIFAPECNPT